MRYGFQYVKPIEGDYKQYGKLTLGSLPIRPDGQWDDWCPPDEDQNNGFEPQSCTSNGTLTCVEILQRQEYQDTTDWSERFLANVSGTTMWGNDPQKVAETLRKKGTVHESDLPYTPDINTWAKYYDTIPYELEVRALAKFKGTYDFGHQYVGTDPQSMMNRLQYSPLGADVYAWRELNGKYIRNGMGSNHWICIYGYEKGKYWKCMDSYGGQTNKKKLAWDFGFTVVKEYTLHKQLVSQSLWAIAINWLRARLGLPAMQTV